MKILIALLLAVFLFSSGNAQQSFIKSYTGGATGNHKRVLPASDNGFVVFSVDSLTLSKFTSCGTNEWNRRYHNPDVNYTGHLSDVIRLASGGFAFLSRVSHNGLDLPLVTRLDEQGNVLWSKAIGDTRFNHYTYSILEDKTGNLVLYGNVSQANSSIIFSMVTKLTISGELIWSRFYSHGWVWGAAIVTSDNGLLARTGNIFFKTLEDGAVEWTYRVSPSLAEGYIAPVEVPDGYIFTTIGAGSGEVNFHKLDKYGNGLWNGRRHSNLMATGSQQRLRPVANGNFAGIFSRVVRGRSFPVLIEFDKDLNIVKLAGSPGKEPEAPEYQATGFCYLSDRTAMLTGNLHAGGNAAVSFIAKADDYNRFSCDTLLYDISFNLEPVTQSFGSTNSYPSPFYTIDKVINVSDFSVQVSDVCATPLVADIQIGPDTLLCSGTSLALLNKGNFIFESYEWSSGETTPAISVSEPGIYWLRATYNCGQSVAADTIAVSIKQIPSPNLVADTSFCASDAVLLDAGLPGATYLWNDGSTQPQLVVSSPGNYYVDITYDNCASRYSTVVNDCEVLEIPNIFTPNGDQVNDFFEPKNMRGITSAELTVYNRWGKKLHSTNNLQHFNWNGKANGTTCSDGIYFYHISYTNFLNEQKEVKGYLQMFSN